MGYPYVIAVMCHDISMSDVRRFLKAMNHADARAKIERDNRARQHQYARRAQQNATHIRNRNIAHMQRTKRK